MKIWAPLSLLNWGTDYDNLGRLEFWKYIAIYFFWVLSISISSNQSGGFLILLSPVIPMIVQSVVGELFPSHIVLDKLILELFRACFGVDGPWQFTEFNRVQGIIEQFVLVPGR